MLDKILNILERNKYQVILHTTDTGFTIQYPDRIEYPQFEQKIDEFYINDDNITINTDIIQLPKYAHLTFCMSKMVAECNKRLYNASLIRYIHKNKDVVADDFWNYVPFNMSLEDKDKDKTLRGIVDLFIKDASQAMEISKKHGLEDIVRFIFAVLINKE